MKLFTKTSLILFLVAMLFTVSLFSQNKYSNTKVNDLSDSLIAYYPFNGNANDESGNSNNGTITGASFVSDRFDNENSALILNGTDDYVIFNDPAFDFSKQFSISWWMKTESNKNDQRLLFKNNEPPHRSWFISLNKDSTGKLSFYYSSNGSEFESFTSNAIYNDGEWHHVVFTFDGNTQTAKFYKDNQLDAQDTTVSSSLFLNDQPFSIGNTNDGPADLYSGVIDDIKVYNYPLSDNKIDELYHENGWIGNEVAFYPFNGNAKDESGNGNDGTITGASFVSDRFDNENSALILNGTDDYVIFNDPAFDFSKQFSISWWMKTESNKNDQRLLFKNNDPPHRSWFISLNKISTGKLSFFYSSNGSDIKSFTSSVIYNDGEWHHVVFTFDSKTQTAKFYKDNQLDAQDTTVSSSLFLNDQPFSIGNTNDGSTDLYSGVIDDIRVYNYPIPVNKINELYHEDGWIGNSSIEENVALSSIGATAWDNGSFSDYGIDQDAMYTIDNSSDTYWAGLQDSTPQTMWIQFDKKYSINKVNVVENRSDAIMLTGTIKYFDGNEWHDLLNISKNEPNYYAEFPAVEAEQIELQVTSVTAPASWYNKVALIHAVEVNGQPITDISTNVHANKIKSYVLSQNYPNPFNPTTTIRYALPKATNVELSIYNTLGQKVRTLVHKSQHAGQYQVKWDGRNDLGRNDVSGVYFYKMVAGNFVKVKKMLLIK